MVMPHLLRHVGERLARYLLLTGELIDAPQALQAGLINALAPGESLLTHALHWAESIVAGGPLAITKTKELLDSFSHQALSVEQAAQESAAPRLTQECREGLTAFFEKRQPPWLSGD
jgi:methylglutaconyl-CoA hydratase